MRNAWLTGLAAALLLWVGCGSDNPAGDGGRDMGRDVPVDMAPDMPVVFCDGDGDCPANQRCVMNRCVPRTCQSNEDCDNGQRCDLKTMTCVPLPDGGPDMQPDRPDMGGPNITCGPGRPVDFVAYVNDMIRTKTLETNDPEPIAACEFINLALDNENAFNPLPTPGP